MINQNIINLTLDFINKLKLILIFKKTYNLSKIESMVLVSSTRVKA